MKTIRKGVFETNSSSTHSVCVCTDEELKAWKNNEIFWDTYNDQFISKESLFKDIIRSEDETDQDLLEELLKNPREFDVETYESFGEDYARSVYYYTTPKGEHINIFCYYGYDY